MSDFPAEIDVTLLCERYGSQLDTLQETLPAGLFETLVTPTTIRDGKEAFLAFRYGTKKYKITFEQVDRLRMPKETKDG